MSRYTFYDQSGLVKNVINLPEGWAGGTGAWNPPSGFSVEQVSDNLRVNPGDTRTGPGIYTPGTPPPPDPEVVIKSNFENKLEAAVNRVQQIQSNIVGANLANSQVAIKDIAEFLEAIGKRLGQWKG